MPEALPREILEALRPLEDNLASFVEKGDLPRAKQVTSKIVLLLDGYGDHHRLLYAKLRCFETAVEANSISWASSGLIGVRAKASEGTRLFLEATGLLAVCALREKNIEEAKRLVRYVINHVNHIKSDSQRQDFQKRVIARIEEECILSELIGTGSDDLDPVKVHEQAVLLIQHKSDDEIYALIGSAVPNRTLGVLKEVRDDAILQVAPSDRKLLPAPEEAMKPPNLGKRAFAALRRIAWRTLCDPNSEIYDLWATKNPRVMTVGYFASAVSAALKSWQIGSFMLAAGIAAIAMKFTAAEFCKWTKPTTIMIPKSEKG